jgi:hypothetical protein
MDEVTRERRFLTFNGPLEAGVRAVAVLGAAFPRAFDLQRLTVYDYLLMHTHQLGGPDDLHPATPIKTPATEVRRKIVQDAIYLMMTGEFIAREVYADGIRYRAGETAGFFLDSLQTPYLRELRIRADWLVEHLADYSDGNFDSLMRQFFDSWVVEFQAIEESLGGEA